MSERNPRELDIQIEVNPEYPDIGIDVGSQSREIRIGVDGIMRPTSYDNLSNKPQINGVELSGNMSISDLRAVLSNTKAAWDADMWFVPLAGQIVLYTDYYGQDKPAIKVGDGSAFLIDLPVAGEGLAEQVASALGLHAADRNIHVTSEKQSFWDNKLNYEVAGEELKFTRN